MLSPKHIAKLATHKPALLFAGGIATAIIGKKIIESDFVKNAATEAMAGVMTAKQNAEDTFEQMRSDAENQISDEEKVEIEIESKD